MELNDTIELMRSKDYTDRFLAEYYQTKIRYEKLAKIINKHVEGTLEFELKARIKTLICQKIVMETYLNVLHERAEEEGINIEGGK